MIQRIIPSSKEQLPVIGLGTWQTFDVAGNKEYPELTAVLTEMHASGGRLIDSSPMYGNAEKVVGDLTLGLSTKDEFFYATKVWTTGRQQGIAQMQSSMKKMQRKTTDLMQIHNLTDWKTHMPVLKKWKEQGIIRYIGITHYTDAMHETLEKIITTETMDFVQFNYSIDDTHAERRLLPAAAEHGVATLINRPFGEGGLFRKIRGKDLPQWAVEEGIDSWSAFFLRFIISHPAVTCVIPATSNPLHAADNFKAGRSAALQPGIRAKMLDHISNL